MDSYFNLVCFSGVEPRTLVESEVENQGHERHKFCSLIQILHFADEKIDRRCSVIHLQQHIMLVSHSNAYFLEGQSPLAMFV